MAVIGTKGVPRAEREQQILDVAVDEFAARGYAGASMVDIAGQAGISKPLVYQYFGSKDGLYLACLQRVGDALLERIDRAYSREDDTVAARLHTLRAIFEALEPQRHAWRLLHDTSVPDSGAIAQAARGYRTRMSELATVGSAQFLRARGRADALDATALAAVWTGLVDSLVTWWLDHPGENAHDMTGRCERLMGAVFD